VGKRALSVALELIFCYYRMPMARTGTYNNANRSNDSHTRRSDGDRGLIIAIYIP